MGRRKILCLDFDGVIHSYESGWKGPRLIPDPPVEGALAFLAQAVNRFEVHIYSSRSRYFGGRWAMKQWLKLWFWRTVSRPDDPLNIEGMPYKDTSAYVNSIIREIRFPSYKPPASISLDDRALTFTGIFPSLDKLDSFKPWNKQ